MKREALMGRRLFSLALAFLLAGCGPAAESPAPQPSGSVNTPVGTPAPMETSAPTPKPIPNDGPYVYTDYSKLESNSPQRDIYVRWHGKFTDHLIPSPDYGPLIPFSGDGAVEGWQATYYVPQGLMTLEGKVVVDPVYSAVTQLCSGGDFGFGYPDTYYSAFLLSRYAGDGEGDLFGGHKDVVSALCAADGSWVTPEYRFSYAAMCYGEGVQSGAIFALRDKNVLCLLDIATGEEIFSAFLDGLGENTLDNLLDSVYYCDDRITLNAPIYDQDYNVTGKLLRCWDVTTRREIPLPEDVDVIYGFSEGLCPARRTGGEGYAWGYLGLDGQWAIPPQFTDAKPFEGGVALLGTHAHQLIDRQGNVLYETPTYDHCQQTGDYWHFTGYSGDAGLVLDKEGSEVNSPLLHGGTVHVLDHGWAAMENPDGSLTLAKGEKSWLVPEAWGYIWRNNVTEDAIYLGGWATDGDDPHWAIWQPESGKAPTVFPGVLDSLRTDPVTKQRYCVILDGYGDDHTCHITDGEGKPLFEGLSGGSWSFSLYAGRCLTETSGDQGRTVELRDQGGKLLLRRWWEAPFD